jgi:hypothetical protein
VTTANWQKAHLSWSPWVPLEGIGRDRSVSDLPGLYRIRSVETGRILYVGQTGRSLRGRLAQLKGVYGELMPYNDPHTVGPALWAHRIDTGETFEASVVVLEVDRADRMGREALEITKQRIIDGCSPAYNFGRMPHGWIKSTGNNRRLVEAGGRFRGRRMSEGELAELPADPSVPPPVTLDDDVRSPDWLGLAWRQAESSPPARSDVGVYRIGGSVPGPLDYLGQGRIAARWHAHSRGWALDLAAEAPGRSVWDWVGLDLTARQLLEVENDLIAGHMVVFRAPPRAQFGHSSRVVPDIGAPSG